MTSEERKEARFQRRRAKRESKKCLRVQQIGDYESIFTYINLYEAFYECRKGVRWKASVQKYEACLPFNTLKIYNQLQAKKFKKLKFLEFDINERGKIRHIMAETIEDRCIQKVLCNKYLYPMLAPKLIYDNGASLKGKGTDFSLRRLKTQLLRHYRHYGNNGYIFQYDFSKYFENIDHDVLLKLLRKDIVDDDIYNLTKSVINSFGAKGLGLGSQVSQICAIYLPTLIDRYFKEVLKIKGYGRYMDDGYAICRDMNEIKKCKEGLAKMAAMLNIKLNVNKITVSKLSHTFTFLKKRIVLTKTGKVIVKVSTKAAHQARRRLVKMFKKYCGSEVTRAYIRDSFRSQAGISACYQNYYITQNYKSLYQRLSEQYQC